jgi:hypothetical protein
LSILPYFDKYTSQFDWFFWSPLNTAVGYLSCWTTVSFRVLICHSQEMLKLPYRTSANMWNCVYMCMSVPLCFVIVSCRKFNIQFQNDLVVYELIWYFISPHYWYL